MKGRYQVTRTTSLGGVYKILDSFSSFGEAQDEARKRARATPGRTFLVMDKVSGLTLYEYQVEGPWWAFWRNWSRTGAMGEDDEPLG